MRHTLERVNLQVMNIEGGPLSKGTEKICKGIITKKNILRVRKRDVNPYARHLGHYTDNARKELYIIL